MTLANRITLLRILLVPLFAGALLYHSESHAEGYRGNGWYYAAVGLFALAAFSDGIDSNCLLPAANPECRSMAANQERGSQ